MTWNCSKSHSQREQNNADITHFNTCLLGVGVGREPVATGEGGGARGPLEQPRLPLFNEMGAMKAEVADEVSKCHKGEPMDRRCPHFTGEKTEAQGS